MRDETPGFYHVKHFISQTAFKCVWCFEERKDGDGLDMCRGETLHTWVIGCWGRNWQAENLEDQRDLWMEWNRTWGLSVRERRKSGVGLDGGRRFAGEKKKKKSCKTFSTKSKCLCAQRSSFVYDFIKGDCTHWHYKMLIPIKNDI